MANETNTTTSIDDKMRYGISALDSSYHSHAVDDELMVDGASGKMLYKRASDGLVVSHDDTTYSKEDLVEKIIELTNESINLSDEKLLILLSENVDIIYRSIDIKDLKILGGGNSTTNFPSSISDFSFSVPKYVPVIYFGTSVDHMNDKVISSAIQETYHRLEYSEDESDIEIMKKITQEALVSIGLDVVGVDVNGNEVGDHIINTVSIPYNNLFMFDFSSMFEEDESIDEFIVKVTSISLSPLYDILNSTKLTIDADGLYGNTDYILSTLDIVSMGMPNLTKANISTHTDVTSSSVKLNYRINGYELCKKVLNNSSGNGIYLSEKEPSRSCIWGKIISV